MSIADLFRPKWKHSNPVVRLDAVKCLTDERTLADVAKNDGSRDVRWAAVKKVTNQAALADIALNSKWQDTAEAAVERVTNQDSLAAVAKSANDHDVRWAAVKRVTDAAVISKLATVIADIAKNNVQALSRVHDQGTLADIAVNAATPDIGVEAVARLEDMGVLEDLAEHAPEQEVRWAAQVRTVSLGKVGDDTLLARIVRDSGHGRTRVAALAVMRDQALIASIAVHKSGTVSGNSVQMQAVVMLTDPGMLVRVIREVKDIGRIELAIKNLADESALLDLLAMHWNLGDRAPFAVVTEGRLSEASLVFIAKTYPGMLSTAAVQRISDPTVLASLAMVSSVVGDRLAVVEKLDDQAILTSIARNDGALAVRIAAVSKLNDVSVRQAITEELQGIIDRELGQKQWPSAWRSLNHGPTLIAMLKSSSAARSTCQYFDSGICMARISRGYRGHGPEQCSWVDRSPSGCNVLSLYPS